MAKINTTPNLLTIASPMAVPAKKLRDVRNQKLPAERIVLHITGTNTYVNAMRSKTPPLDRVENYFDGDGNPFAHYTVDPWSRVRRHANENERPWSQGWGGQGGRSGVLRKITPEWWREAHPGDHAMNSLFPTGTPNDRSVSIEFVQFQPGTIKRGKYVGKRNYKLTIAQYLIGNMLARDIAIRHGKYFPTSAFDRTASETTDGVMQLLGHEDCDPWGRGKPKSGGWDPGALRPKGKRFCWSCFITLDFGSCDCGCVIPTPPMPTWAE